jgi:hypothetical protein
MQRGVNHGSWQYENSCSLALGKGVRCQPRRWVQAPSLIEKET